MIKIISILNPTILKYKSIIDEIPIHLNDCNILYSDFDSAVKNSIFSENSDETVFILISSDDDNCNKLIKILSKPQTSQFPSIILLSTLLTWCGLNKKIKLNFDSSNISSQFEGRCPSFAALKEYKVENSLWQLAKYGTNVNLSVISIGLVYGKDGYDFKDIFMSIWEQKSLNIKSKHGAETSNSIPMIYYKDLITIICNDIRSKAFDNSKRYKCFICVDGVNAKVSEILQQIYFLSNGCKTEIKCLSFDEFESRLLSSQNIKELQLWQTNVVTSKTSNNFTNLLSNFDFVWSEFLRVNNLNACNIIVLGSPFSGKTEFATELSKKLNLCYVNLPTAIRYTLDSMDEDAASTIEEETEISSVDISKSFRLELVSLLKTKLSETKKIKNHDEIVLSPEFLNLNAEFCQSLTSSAALLRKCVNAMISKHSKQGYVLDLFDTNLLNTVEDMIECGCIQYDQSEEPILLKSPDIIFNLKVNDDIAIERFKLKSGIVEVVSAARPKATGNKDKGNSTASSTSKLSKSDAALVKEFEKKISMRVESAKHQEPAPEMVELTFNLIAEIESRFNEIFIKSVDNNETDMNKIISSMTDIVYDVHGPFGWLPTQSNPLDILDTTTLENEYESIDDYQTLNFQTKDTVNTSDVVEALDSVEDRLLRQRLLEFEDYMAMNVLPVVANGMVFMQRSQSNDPINYMYEYLLNQADIVQTNVVQDARDTFNKLLMDAESHLNSQ